MNDTQPAQTDLDRQVIANLRDMLAESEIKVATLAALADIRAQRIKELETQLEQQTTEDTDGDDR